MKTKPPPKRSTLMPANVKNNFAASPRSRARNGAAARGALKESSLAPLLFSPGGFSEPTGLEGESARANSPNNNQQIMPAPKMIDRVRTNLPLYGNRLVT